MKNQKHEETLQKAASQDFSSIVRNQEPKKFESHVSEFSKVTESRWGYIPHPKLEEKSETRPNPLRESKEYLKRLYSKNCSSARG